MGYNEEKTKSVLKHTLISVLSFNTNTKETAEKGHALTLVQKRGQSEPLTFHLKEKLWPRAGCSSEVEH